MEDDEKVDTNIEKSGEKIKQEEANEQEDEKTDEAEVLDEEKLPDKSEKNDKLDQTADEKSGDVANEPLVSEVELKIEEVSALVNEVENEPPPAIEECDTGGDEIPSEIYVNEPNPAVQIEEVAEVLNISHDSNQEPLLLTELKSAVSEDPQVESTMEVRSEIVAIDDDDDDEEDEDGVVDDVEEDDDDEEDDDVEGVSNEALNDDDEEDDEDLYDDRENQKSRLNNSSREPLQSSQMEDFDDDYDDEDEEDMVDIKDDSNGAVIIGSSDDEDEPEQKRPPTQAKKPPQQQQKIEKYEDIDDDLDYEDDDDDDEYDDDDLMDAVVTSAAKGLSPAKKRQRSESPVDARQREAHAISILTRRINYGRIAKKKSLNWLYNKKKREAYKLILPRRRPSTTAEAMRSDQSGGLLHLKISSPSIAQKSIIKPSSSTPIISRIESGIKTLQKQEKEEFVIDLDSSPEKSTEKFAPRCQSGDLRSLKKPPDNKEEEAEEQERNTMQQTDKVRDSIQKSEEVEEVKSVSRLTSEQNKENLQSNEVLKKESEEVTKHDLDSKEAIPTDEQMEIGENINESTLKAPDQTNISVTTLKTDIKVEVAKVTPPPAEETTASKVAIEDVKEKDTNQTTSSTNLPTTAGGASKRRRSSSHGHDKNKTPKPSSGGNDDDEEYIHPTKKLREELQSCYPAHDRILNEYIEKTSNDSIDTIQRHIDQMLSEIETLNEMMKAKEIEWNNMLHLKKVKEEICFRLTRRKQCMEVMAIKVGETSHSAGLDEDYLGNESALVLGKSTTAKPNPQLSSTPIAAAINSLSSNICNFTAVSSSSSAAQTTAQLLIQNRANMKSSDLVKEKANTQRLHRLLVSRNILPKPTASAAANNSQQSPSTNGPSTPNASNQPILNSYLTGTDSVQQLVDMMNGHHNHTGLHNGGNAGGNNSQAAMVGRQGPFKDVRSIIADFRQQHPEVVPRRGRRVKNSNNSNLSDSNTILGNALKSDTNSRPSSNDSSSHSVGNNTNQVTTNHNSVNSFKDVLAPFSKSQGAVRSAGGQQQNPPYPEVTLHPVSTPLNASGGQDQPTGSLLHGILTKFSRPNESANTKINANQSSANYISNFSPTLARLLTAPERISPSAAGSNANQSHHSTVGGGDSVGNNSSSAHHSMPGFGVNLSKVVGHNSEITITPVINSMQQSLLQQQLHQQQQQQLKEVLTRTAAAISGNNIKDEHFLKLSSFAVPTGGNDDDAEDSVDRLVIDEGVDSMVGGEEHQRIAPHAIGQEFNENEVPVCQGCKKHEAQFVCAGCGNQWYCSRECQVTAWDDHSEVCTATKQIRNNFNILKTRDLERDDEYFIVRRRKRNKFYPQFY